MKRVLVSGKKHYIYVSIGLPLAILLLFLVSLGVSAQLQDRLVFVLSPLLALVVILFDLLFCKSLVTATDSEIIVGSLLRKSIIRYNLKDLKEVKIKTILLGKNFDDYVVMNFSDEPIDSKELHEFYKLSDMVFFVADDTSLKFIREILAGLSMENLVIDIDK